MNLIRRISAALFVFCLTINLLAQLPKITNTSMAYTHLFSATQMFKDSIWEDPISYLPKTKSAIKMPFVWQYGRYKPDSIFVGDGFIQWFIHHNHDTMVRFGLFTDLIDRGTGGSKSLSLISYKTENSSPSRILKIQFRNFGFFGQSQAGKALNDSGNMQIWIYENAQKYEMHFGLSSIKDSVNSYLNDKGINIQMAIFKGNAANPLYSNIVTGSLSAPVWGDALTSPTVKGMPANGSVLLFQQGVLSTPSFNTLNNAKTVYQYGNTLYTTEKINAIDILDLNGRLVSKIVVTAGTADVSNLKPGVYFAKTPNRILKIIVN